MDINTEPRIFRIPLDTARTRARFDFEGNYLSCVNASHYNASLSVAFNNLDNDLIPVEKGVSIRRSFIKIFLTNTEQTSKWVDLLVGYYSPHTLEYIDNRKIIVPVVTLHSSIAVISSTTPVTVVTGMAGLKTRIWSLTVSNNNTTTAAYIEYGFGTNPTYRHRMRLRPETSLIRYFQNGWQEGANADDFKTRLDASVPDLHVTAEYTTE